MISNHNVYRINYCGLKLKLMKKTLFPFLFVFCTAATFGQGLAVNNTGSAADGSAMLDISSTTRGALFPRMTLAQRTTIATPATGLLVYQTDGLNGFYYNAGTPVVPNWIRLSAENYWTLSGSNIYNNNTGNVGIGIINPAEKLHVSGTAPNIATINGSNQMYITLSENGSPKGYIGSFNQSVTADDVDFGTFSGTTGALHLTTQGTPRLTVGNAGNIGIGLTTPNAPLQFSNSIVNRKIVLYDNNNNDHQYYGFGINGGTLRYQTDATGADHIFYAAASATLSNELMRITGTGNVGIGGITPAFRLDVNGRMRIRDGGGGNTAGLWLNNAANTASPAFIGMENDNSVGIFGNPSSGWSFTMNTTTGKVKIADGTQANGRVLTSDANGTASWTQLNSTQSVRTGSLGGGVNFDYSEMGSFPTGGTSKYTTVNITLPPGRWVVFANLLINGTALPAGGGIFVRTYLAESATVSTGTTDIVPGTGGLISGNFSYSNTFTFVSGQIFVNNTSGANKTYYLWALGARNASAPATGSAIGALGSSFWAENQLFAIPMN
jgi:hypothetical protein